MSVLLDIPYRGSEDDVNVDSLHYVDAGTVDVASTPRTARYWETHQTAPRANTASSSFTRTTTASFCSALLLSVTCQLV